MGNLERINSQALLSSEDQTALQTSPRRSLSSRELATIARLQGMMAASYPNQEILPGAPDVWREEWTEIVQLHGLDVLEEALKRHRKASSFLPSVRDVHEQVDAIRAERTAQKEQAWAERKRCGECTSDGWIVKQREDGTQFVVRCPCFEAWKASMQAVGA